MWPRLLLWDLVELWPHPGQRTKSERIYTVPERPPCQPRRGSSCLRFWPNQGTPPSRSRKRKHWVHCSWPFTQCTYQLSALVLLPRAPNFNADDYFSALHNMLAEAESTNPRETIPSNLVVLGDLNALHTRWDTLSLPNTAGKRACALFDDFNLTQCITSPTRFSADATSCSVLDVFATNRPELVQSVEISDPISDHCLVEVELLTRLPEEKRRCFTFFDYVNADWEGLCSALSRASLTEAIQGTTCVNTAWTVWESIVLQITRRYIPSRTITLHRKNKPWMTPYLHRLHRKKTLLFKQARHTQNLEDWQRYRKHRNHCTNEFRKEQRRLGPAKKGSQNLILKLLEMLAISQFKARFQARNQF